MTAETLLDTSASPEVTRPEVRREDMITMAEAKEVFSEHGIWRDVITLGRYTKTLHNEFLLPYLQLGRERYTSVKACRWFIRYAGPFKRSCKQPKPPVASGMTRKEAEALAAEEVATQITEPAPVGGQAVEIACGISSLRLRWRGDGMIEANAQHPSHGLCVLRLDKTAMLKLAAHAGRLACALGTVPTGVDV